MVSIMRLESVGRAGDTISGAAALHCFPGGSQKPGQALSFTSVSLNPASQAAVLVSQFYYKRCICGVKRSWGRSDCTAALPSDN